MCAFNSLSKVFSDLKMKNHGNKESAVLTKEAQKFAYKKEKLKFSNSLERGNLRKALKLRLKSHNPVYLRNISRQILRCFYSIILTGSRVEETNLLQTLGHILPKAKMSSVNAISLL